MFKRHSAARNLRRPSSSSLTSPQPARTLVLSGNTSVASLPLHSQDAAAVPHTPLEPTHEEEPLFDDDRFLRSDLFDMMSSPALSDQGSTFTAFVAKPLVLDGEPDHLHAAAADDDELTLDELAERVTFCHGDIATRVYIAYVGRPKVVDVSPPASIRQRPVSMGFYPHHHSSRSNSNSSAHTRASSYSVDSRHSRSSSASSVSETFSTPSVSPTTAEHPLVDSFPLPRPKTSLHRKGLSQSAPRHLREKIEARLSEDQSRSLRSSARSSLSLDVNPLAQASPRKTASKGLARKAGGWFRRKNDAELDQPSPVA